MDRTIAIDLERKYRDFTSRFEEMTQISTRVADKKTVQGMRRALAEMLFLLDDAVLEPTKKAHPDLFP